jgi:hypothetical protein
LDIANIRLVLIAGRGFPYKGEPSVENEVAAGAWADEIAKPVKHDVNVTSMPLHGILYAGQDSVNRADNPR